MNVVILIGLLIREPLHTRVALMRAAVIVTSAYRRWQCLWTPLLGIGRLFVSVWRVMCRIVMLLGITRVRSMMMHLLVRVRETRLSPDGRENIALETSGLLVWTSVL